MFCDERSVEVILDLVAPVGVSQLSERLSLDLADTLTGDLELLSNLFKGAGSAVYQTES